MFDLPLRLEAIHAHCAASPAAPVALIVPDVTRRPAPLPLPSLPSLQVGVTNFDVPRLEAMRKAGVEIASNQVRGGLDGGLSCATQGRRCAWSHTAPAFLLAPVDLGRTVSPSQCLGLFDSVRPRLQHTPRWRAPKQVQFSLLDRRPRVAMIEYCRANGISLLPYGVVAGGFLSDK